MDRDRWNFIGDDVDFPNYLIEVRKPNGDTPVREHIEPKAVRPGIVKVYRNAIDRAVDKLNEIPGTDDDPNLIPVPWPKATRPKIPTDKWGDANLASFTIEELKATQDYIRRDTVEWHLQHLNDAAHDNKAMPNVLVTNDGELIYDGHHRLAALWLLGATTANCWTLEYE